MVVTRISNSRRGSRIVLRAVLSDNHSPHILENDGDGEQANSRVAERQQQQEREQQQHHQHDDEKDEEQLTKHQKPELMQEQEQHQCEASGKMHPTDEALQKAEADDVSQVEQLMPLHAVGVKDFIDEDEECAAENGTDPRHQQETADVTVSSAKRKRADIDESETDETDVESDDFEELPEEEDEENDNAFDASESQATANESSSSPAATTAAATTPSPIKNRRPSRSCKPNSLIFNSDTTTLSPKRRQKTVQSISSSTPAAISRKSFSSNDQQSVSLSASASAVDFMNSSRKGSSSSREQPVISSRSFARESVRKAVSALTGLNRPVKKLGRPRKYPIDETASELASPVKNGRIAVRKGGKGRKVTVRGKKLSGKKGSPAGKCTPILTAILSGQSLAQTKTGRPKGRPRILPSLDEVILNGAKSSTPSSSTSATATRSSLRRGCDCEAKYKKILGNLEQSLEVRFAESTQKLRKDMEQTEAENSRLQGRIVTLQRELDYLKNRLDHTKETTASRQEIEELKLKHQYELSLAKRTQWCANCERESIYFCCWNSSYCSLECQQHHWHAVHKKVCRNKDVKR